MRLPRDTSNKIAQLFTPYRVQVVTATEPWTPGTDDIGIDCVVDQGIKINGGTEFPRSAGMPMGVVQGFTYTFSITSVILVM